MSDAPPAPPRVLPVRYPPPPPLPPPAGGGAGRALLLLILFLSLGLNLLICGGGLFFGLFGGGSEGPLVQEHFHSGTSGATDKIAVVQIEGAIMEGLLGYAH